MIGPVITGNPVVSPVMLIGQAPGVHEGPAGKPFAWTAGKTMFGWFAQLGLPDVLFFSLFLGAADRFGLRIGLTWVLMALSFGATLALAVGFDISGLPALPLLSVAFVLANADHLWRYYRDWRSARDSK